MGKRLTRGQAIRKYCLWCTCGQPDEVKLCPSKDCPLWIYRLGYEIIPETGSRIGKNRANDIEATNSSSER